MGKIPMEDCHGDIHVDGDQYRIIDRRMREIKRQLDQNGGCPSDPAKIAKGLQYIIEGRFTTPTSYPLTVDRTLTRQQMINAGHYNYVNSFIATRFPVSGNGIVKEDGILVHLDCNINTPNAKRRIDAMGLRRGDVDEICAFGAQYPEVQRDFPIVELGQVSGVVAYLYGGVGVRGLHLRSVRVRCDWARDCRFLAFCKF